MGGKYNDEFGPQVNLTILFVGKKIYVPNILHYFFDLSLVVKVKEGNL